MVTLLKDGLGWLFYARSRLMGSRKCRTIGEDEILILLCPGDTRPRNVVFLVAVMRGARRCKERHGGELNTATTTRVSKK